MKAILEEARELASAHRKSDPATRIVKYFPSGRANQLRLLEVSETAPTTGEVMPFTFSADPAHGVHHASTIVLLSPEEWAAVQDGKLDLPPDWDLSTAEDL